MFDFGDGFEQRINKDVAFSRSNGEGVVESYKGLNSFVLNFKNLSHVNESLGDPANLLWFFYKDREGSNLAFYYYNPAENDTIDPTGVDDVGRYLCRFKEDNMSRELFVKNFYNHTGITIVEVNE